LLEDLFLEPLQVSEELVDESVEVFQVKSLEKTEHSVVLDHLVVQTDEEIESVALEKRGLVLSVVKFQTFLGDFVGDFLLVVDYDRECLLNRLCIFLVSDEIDENVYEIGGDFLMGLFAQVYDYL
jgi:hypothetical protein